MASLPHRVKAKTSARWAKGKEALRAPIEGGPRAALTLWGAAKVPEPGEKHGQAVDAHPKPPAQAHAQWGYGALV